MSRMARLSVCCLFVAVSASTFGCYLAREIRYSKNPVWPDPQKRPSDESKPMPFDAWLLYESGLYDGNPHHRYNIYQARAGYQDYLTAWALGHGQPAPIHSTLQQPPIIPTHYSHDVNVNVQR
jgi:hypothetical protein